MSVSTDPIELKIRPRLVSNLYVSVEVESTRVSLEFMSVQKFIVVTFSDTRRQTLL